MAVLVAGIALALGTTGHDWYAAWKLTLTEAMLSVGFSEFGAVEYRTADGESVTVARYRFAHMMHEAWSARRQILSLAADRAVLGAWTGLALFATWLGVWAAGRLRRFAGRSGKVVEPAPQVRRRYEGRMHHTDDWSDSELIAALSRRSGRMGVLLVAPGEIDRRAGGGLDANGPPAMLAESLPPARVPGLPPPESVEPAGEVAVPAKQAPADPGSGPDTATGDNPTGSRAVSHGREPGEQFF
ncbi:MAG: hypothetical protein OXI20_14735 [Rhodospirillales bacterium]|nr:hypothetical protein [Rhodospirillales bacterium]